MKDLKAFLGGKTRAKTVSWDSHKEKCEELFLISGWILRKLTEKFSFSAQTCDYFIVLS